MRSMCRILVASAVAALAFPQLAMADQKIEEQLRLMNERMSQLEQQLGATQDELEASKNTVDRQQVMQGPLQLHVGQSTRLNTSDCRVQGLLAVAQPERSVAQKGLRLLSVQIARIGRRHFTFINSIDNANPSRHG